MCLCGAELKPLGHGQGFVTKDGFKSSSSIGPPSFSTELQLPVALPLWFIPAAAICSLSAGRVLGRFLLGDAHPDWFLTWPCDASVSSSASFVEGPTLLVNASEEQAARYGLSKRIRFRPEASFDLVAFCYDFSADC
jgi:hypothetical protein